MNKDNPFPGMNPFLEAFWPDVHTALIGYIRDELAEQLPEGLKARSEEQVNLASEEDERSRQARADVAVIESWKGGGAPQWQPGESRHPGGAVATEPLYCITEEEVERWIEITDRHGRLVTVIEVLSPANKDQGRDPYVVKRRSYVAGGVNVVEIDLLRGGQHVLNIPRSSLPDPKVPYLICVTRAAIPSRKEFYPVALGSRLPNIRVPLRVTDPDAVLPLQPLIDRCYRKGSYWEESHDQLPGPPLDSAEAEWLKDRLKSSGLMP